MSAKVDGTVTIAGYQIIEQLYSGSRTQVDRAVREGDRLPVVIKLLKQEYPTFSELVQFRNQYPIAKNLDIPPIIKPYSLEAHRNGYARAISVIAFSYPKNSTDANRKCKRYWRHLVMLPMVPPN